MNVRSIEIPEKKEFGCVGQVSNSPPCLQHLRFICSVQGLSRPSALLKCSPPPKKRRSCRGKYCLSHWWSQTCEVEQKTFLSATNEEREKEA